MHFLNSLTSISVKRERWEAENLLDHTEMA